MKDAIKAETDAALKCLQKICDLLWWNGGFAISDVNGWASKARGHLYALGIKTESRRTNRE